MTSLKKPNFAMVGKLMEEGEEEQEQEEQEVTNL